MATAENAMKSTSKTRLQAKGLNQDLIICKGLDSNNIYWNCSILKLDQLKRKCLVGYFLLRFELLETCNFTPTIPKIVIIQWINEP